MQSVSICDVFVVVVVAGAAVVGFLLLQFQFVVITQKLLNYINLVVESNACTYIHNCTMFGYRRAFESDTYSAQK